MILISFIHFVPWFLADDQMAGQLLESDVHSFQLYFFHILNYLSRNQEKPQFWI